MTSIPPSNFFQAMRPTGSRPGFAVLDFETTGFSRHDRVIEIGVVLLDANCRVERTWQTLVQPNRGFDNSDVHGIRPTDLVGAPTFEHVARRFADVLNGRIVVAHNAGFEYKFLANEFGRLGVELADGHWMLDTMVLARQFIPGQPVSLKNVLSIMGIENRAAHTALADAEATAAVLQRFVQARPDIVDYADPLYFAPAQLAQLHISDVPLLERNDARAGGDATAAGAGTSQQAPEKLWLQELTQHVPRTGDEASDQYIGYLVQAMVDGRLDMRELAKLHGIAAEHGLSADDVNMLHEQYLQQLIVQAWADGVVTEQERSWLIRIAGELNIERNRVEDLVTSARKLELHPGDRVTFTGAMATPREVWEARARAAGLDVGGVIKASVVLVAADVHTQSGKARKARALGIPVVDEVTFAHALAELNAAQKREAEDTPRPESAADSEESTGSDPMSGLQDLITIFPWLADRDFSGIGEDVLGIAQAWIKNHQTSGLTGLSPYMNFVVFPESPEWQRVLAKLGLTEPEVKDTSLRGRLIRELTVRDLQDLKGYGRVRVQKLVADAVTHAFDEFEAGEAKDIGDVFSSLLGNAQPDEHAAEHSDEHPADTPFDSTDDFGISWDDTTAPETSVLLDWLAITGASKRIFDEAEDKAYVPEAVREQVGSLNDRITDILTGAEREIQHITDQDERFPAILNRRLHDGATLAELGQQFGVSRERVRQLESTLLASLTDAGPDCEILRTGLFHRYAPLALISQLRHDMPGLFTVPDGMSAPLLNLVSLTGTAGAAVPQAQWSVEGEWFIANGFEDKFATAVEQLTDDFGIAPLPELVSELDLPEATVREWIAQRTGYKIFEGHLFTKVTSVSDRAVALLAHRGKPMHIDDIATVITDRNSRGIDGRLALDPRTKRCAPGTWALAQWELEEWTTIADYISRRIDDAVAQGHDGVLLDDVIAGATVFGVSENSVRTYAGGGEFVVEDGYVRKRSAEEMEPVDATPEESRGLYLRDGQWCLLLTITHDHARGSGSAIPAGVAGMYGLGYGEEKLLPSRLGDQRIVVGRTNTSMSTISRFVNDMQLAEGERVWVHFGDTFDITRAPAEDPDAEGLAALVNAFGLDEEFAAELSAEGNAAELDVDAVLAAINRQLGLPADAPRRKTVSRLRHRRDDELADTIQAL
ncbi:exonuclease domain-containing protein [Corynebacterium amycolatum]|uniref:exonuclease domain-containing protein n=1 Tax=Corynebacterium amycolatum TaxID=43765 RepID=UPI0021AE8DF4|nr:exonuclease domain-containing protein [Corynebacterium amycolatum]MCT1547839.1 exonuclease domain-containing protein [Corynebacterium amycolatum]